MLEFPAPTFLYSLKQKLNLENSTLFPWWFLSVGLGEGIIKYFVSYR
jgi:hypothetical protein